MVLVITVKGYTDRQKISLCMTGYIAPFWLSGKYSDLYQKKWMNEWNFAGLHNYVTAGN